MGFAVAEALITAFVWVADHLPQLVATVALIGLVNIVSLAGLALWALWPDTR